MTVMFDNNVIIDVLTNRENSEASIALFMKAASDEITGLLCANSINDIYYVISKLLNPEKARNAISKIMQILYIVPVNVEICSKAIGSEIEDFEDAIIAVCAEENDADYIATSDKKFISSSATVKAISPAMLLEKL